MNLLVPFIWIARGAHLLIAAANWVVPKKLGYHENPKRLNPIVRQVFVLYSIFIVMVVLAFAGLCFFFAPELAAGGALGRALSGFIAAFWLLRALFQLFYVDKEIKSANRLGDWTCTLAILCIGGVFAVAALVIVR